MEATIGEPPCRLSQQQLERYSCIGEGAICQARVQNGICGQPVGFHHQEEADHSTLKGKEMKSDLNEADGGLKPSAEAEIVAQNIYAIGEPPIGSIIAFPSEIIPPNYLCLDGSVIQRNDYPELVDLLNPQGKTATLPDLRGRVILMANQNIRLLSSGGASSITLSEGQLPPHTHQGYVGQTGHKCHSAPVNVSCNQHPHQTGPMGVTGRGEPIQILPPYLSLNYIIKAR